MWFNHSYYGICSFYDCAGIEYRKEGPIFGLGSNIFKLAGSVILYGVVSAWFFGLLRLIIMGG